jgi:hypothetical protein
MGGPRPAQRTGALRAGRGAVFGLRHARDIVHRPGACSQRAHLLAAGDGDVVLPRGLHRSPVPHPLERTRGGTTTVDDRLAARTLGVGRRPANVDKDRAHSLRTPSLHDAVPTHVNRLRRWRRAPRGRHGSVWRLRAGAPAVLPWPAIGLGFCNTLTPVPPRSGEGCPNECGFRALGSGGKRSA